MRGSAVSAVPLYAMGVGRHARGAALGYEIFVGNKNDVTTLREIVETMEGRYRAADRIWVLDRGLVSEDQIEWLKTHDRRYIVGTPKSLLRRFEQA